MSKAIANGKARRDRGEILDAMPPNAIDSERALLSSVLYAGCIDQDVSIPAYEFYDLRNQAIWETLVNLSGEGLTIDHASYLTELRKHRRWGLDGLDDAYAVEVAAAGGSVTRQAWHAEQIHASYVKRTVSHHCEFLLQKTRGNCELSSLADSIQTLSELVPVVDKPQQSILAPCSLRNLIVSYPDMRPVVIGGLLRAGESGNIVASPKRGKSWLAYGLALSVVDGRCWLNTFPCARGRVLILDAELHKEVIAHRIPVVAKAMGIEDYQDQIDVMPLRGLGIDMMNLRSIIEAIEPGRYALVILDAWYRFIPEGFSENDNAQVMSLYNQIDAYAAHLKSAWVNIHHSTKGDQSSKSVTDVGSGAGSQSRAADTHLIMRPHEEESIAVIEAAVRSFPPVAPIAVRWSFPVWEVDGADPRKLKGLQTTRERVAKEKKDIHLDEDRRAIVNAMVNKSEAQTMTDIRNLARVGNPRFGYAWASLIGDETIMPSGTITKGNNRPYEGFTLARRETEG